MELMTIVSQTGKQSEVTDQRRCCIQGSESLASQHTSLQTAPQAFDQTVTVFHPGSTHNRLPPSLFPCLLGCQPPGGPTAFCRLPRGQGPRTPQISRDSHFGPSLISRRFAGHIHQRSSRIFTLIKPPKYYNMGYKQCTIYGFVEKACCC